MGFDLTMFARDEVLEDYVKKPVKITIEDLSDKFDIKITIQAFKKEAT